MVEMPVPAKENPIAKLHLRHVEGLRALAALVVYFNHSYGQVWNLDRNQFPTGSLAPLLYALVAGHYSVSVFIVISGFCLTLPVVRGGGTLRGGTWAFLKRRARRILPPYYGALALSMVLIWTIIGKPTGSLWDIVIHVTPVAVISHLLLLQDFFATSSISYVFWSIAVEWQIYFLFPLFVWAWRRYGPGVVVITALLVSYAVAFRFADTRVTRANPHFVGLFTLGMLAAYVTQSTGRLYALARERFPWAWLCAGTSVTVIGLHALWGFRLAKERFAQIDLLVGIAAATALIVSSRSGGNALARCLSWKPLAFVGTFSYSLYLIHAPLLQILWQYALVPARLEASTMFFLLITAGAVLVLGAAYLFFRVFEEPFMRSPTQGAPQPSEDARVAAT